MTFEEAIQWGRPVEIIEGPKDVFFYLQCNGSVKRAHEPPLADTKIDSGAAWIEWVRGDFWTPCLWEGETVGPWEQSLAPSEKVPPGSSEMMNYYIKKIVKYGFDMQSMHKWLKNMPNSKKGEKQ